VHADAAEQGDILVTYAGLLQFSQQGRNQQVVGAGTGDVIEDDADAVAGTGKQVERFRSNGMGKRLIDRGGYVLHGFSRLRTNQRGLHGGGKGKLEERLAVGDPVGLVLNGMGGSFGGHKAIILFRESNSKLAIIELRAIPGIILLLA